ncbi:PA-phosphatase related phosphoesterase [Fulvivirga imtechensis AK7]|uniref:PA-phosphatase related phosphoesterase n=1 Tax=Fulvivirga imtechensis AK7 TaxID=1237149 RepID=L8JP59_9BACT|nr:phosphatase PAP2 family protein [Fulvivirga imtechensis]ELR69274.1 PA-phosphatase related phosphoesterase [Fulvivirga imtechensis AK7]
MPTIYCFLFITLTINFQCWSQREEVKSPYEVNKKVEIPLMLIGIGITGYGFYKIDQKSGAHASTIENLKLEEEVIKINRHFQPRYSEKANKDSDVLFYASFPIPFLVLFDDNIRRDAGRLSIMYLEALSLTGSMYSMSAAHVDKFRPLVYADNAPMSEKTRGGAKNSFYGGHPSLTATSTFFVAKVVSDYYPERTGLHVTLYSAAAISTLGNAYLRFIAGKHFLTDLMIGIPIGVLNGILVPALHKVRHVNMDRKFSWNLFSGDAHGLTLRYKF